ncbi:MAG: hypothetical protein IJM50_01665 [Lachnospiraceae bacterium]|nr:hypothetical protein [Lachnospiraceae bacterium]
MRKRLKGHLFDMILIFVIFGLMALANMNAYDTAVGHFDKEASAQYSYVAQKTDR